MVTGNSSVKGELDPARLDYLLHQYGIASEFIEFSGKVATIALEHRLHILGTMGHSIATPEQLETAIAARELQAFGHWVPPLFVVHEGEHTVNITERAEHGGTTLHWDLQLEAGDRHRGSVAFANLRFVSSHRAAGRVYERRQLALPVLPPGYHSLRIGDGQTSDDCLLIVAPRQTWQPGCAQQGRRCWGLSVQLYTLQTPGNWGMGDFADLRELVDLAAANGADFVLLNPLHTLDLRYPENASPYSPSDRRFLNPLYIAAALVPDYQDATVQAAVQSADFAERLRHLRQTGDVDYSGVHSLKFQILKLMYRAFRTLPADHARAAEFRAFVAAGGQRLQVFARHQVAMLGGDGAWGELDFHLYMQWLAFAQLEACQEAALAAGMPIGLVRDLAVGSIVDGCEVMTNPDLFCTSARIGAPPDNFNPDGQNWGLPPLHPDVLIQTRCAHFIDLVRSNMTSCGALRIDHVMALMRLWWCPDDGSNASGAYVHYPVDALFAILRLESMRNRCAVIGEDLGVVPPEIREYLEGGAVFSNCVFYFEKYDGWHFRKPEHYKEQALMMIANHDVPPLVAWWNVSDLTLRRQIGLIPGDEELRAAQEYRQGEKQQLLQWLDEQGLLPESWRDRDVGRRLDDDLSLALVKSCARVKSRLLSLQLDDLAGLDMPINIPGTCGEYANWRRKIPVAPQGIFNNILAQQMLKALREARSE